jgi:hypothetical protein
MCRITKKTLIKWINVARTGILLLATLVLLFTHRRLPFEFWLPITDKNKGKNSTKLTSLSQKLQKWEWNLFLPLVFNLTNLFSSENLKSCWLHLGILPTFSFNSGLVRNHAANTTSIVNMNANCKYTCKLDIQAHGDCRSLWRIQLWRTSTWCIELKHSVSHRAMWTSHCVFPEITRIPISSLCRNQCESQFHIRQQNITAEGKN